MNSLEIHGGIPLGGTLQAAGNKNAVLPMIAAALLTDEPVVLENVPDIGDVRTMVAMAEGLGAEIAWSKDARELCIRAADLDPDGMPMELCSAIRASILFVAPLLARCARARIAPPGGDVIGRRRLDAHFYGLRRMGTCIDPAEVFTFETAGRLTGCDLFLPEASVTGTEQVLMAAVLAGGETVIRNAACEPHVCDLARMLVSMGAQIDGVGSNLMRVTGVPALGGARRRVASDHTEVGSFLALAAATGGSVTVTGIDPEHYRMTVPAFERLGIGVQIDGDRIGVSAEQTREIRPDPWGGIPVIDDGPWPQFPSDLMSVMLLLATQVKGTALFFEKMYESRMYFVDRIIAMGANAVICDPHRVVVCGPSKLHGIELTSPDIRAGIALIGAALCASGRSTISNVHLVDRGYENIDGRLAALGARIARM